MAHWTPGGAPGRGSRPSAAGVIWGAGGFASQENLSGGLLVLIFSLALYGPVCGQPLASLARFAGLFLASGAATLVLLIAGTIGVGHTIDVLRHASAQSALVMAGVSNSVWSDNVGLIFTFEVVNGWSGDPLKTEGALRPMLQTYGFAVLLMVVIGLLAGYLGRSWQAASGGQRQFVWKFAGVTLGAYVLHLFALLRSDLSHLAGPSYLLPLFLLALPVFAWRCLRPGLGRGLLLLVSVALIADAAIAGRSELVRHAAAAGDAWKNSMAARDVYRALRAAEGQPLDIASRYSPIPRYQAAFRNTPAFAELEELARAAQRQAAGTPRRADHAHARRSDERSRAALLLRRLPLGLGHHLAARQHLDQSRPRCLDRQGPEGEERLRVLRFAVARRPAVPRLERRNQERRRE